MSAERDSSILNRRELLKGSVLGVSALSALLFSPQKNLAGVPEESPKNSIDLEKRLSQFSTSLSERLETAWSKRNNSLLPYDEYIRIAATVGSEEGLLITEDELEVTCLLQLAPYSPDAGHVRRTISLNNSGGTVVQPNEDRGLLLLQHGLLRDITQRLTNSDPSKELSQSELSSLFTLVEESCQKRYPNMEDISGLVRSEQIRTAEYLLERMWKPLRQSFFDAYRRGERPSPYSMIVTPLQRYWGSIVAALPEETKLTGFRLEYGKLNRKSYDTNIQTVDRPILKGVISQKEWMKAATDGYNHLLIGATGYPEDADKILSGIQIIEIAERALYPAREQVGGMVYSRRSIPLVSEIGNNSAELLSGVVYETVPGVKQICETLHASAAEALRTLQPHKGYSAFHNLVKDLLVGETSYTGDPFTAFPDDPATIRLFVDIVNIHKSKPDLFGGELVVSTTEAERFGRLNGNIDDKWWSSHSELAMTTKQAEPTQVALRTK